MPRYDYMNCSRDTWTTNDIKWYHSIENEINFLDRAVDYVQDKQKADDLGSLLMTTYNRLNSYVDDLEEIFNMLEDKCDKLGIDYPNYYSGGDK